MSDILGLSDTGYNIVALNISKSLAAAFGEPVTPALGGAEVLGAAQVAWVASRRRISRANLILPFVIDKDTGRRRVVGVFVPHDIDGWKESDETYGSRGRRRVCFVGRPAPEDVRDRFLGKFLPEYPGNARNPVRYFF